MFILPTLPIFLGEWNRKHTIDLFCPYRILDLSRWNFMYIVFAKDLASEIKLYLASYKCVITLNLL